MRSAPRGPPRRRRCGPPRRWWTRERRGAMTRIATSWETSVGKKAVMAVTGLILVAYLITHVLANLLVFTGPDRINRYAAILHATGGALWAARLILLVAVILHIVAA